MRRSIAVGIVALVATQAQAHPEGAGADKDPASDESVIPPAPTYKGNGVVVDEHVGARIPLDAKFRTADGMIVTLGDVMRGELPVILTFNYSDCPMLCSVQLNGLTTSLPAIARLGPGPDASKGDVGFHVGAQYRIVTIDLEPNEPLAKIQKMRDRYVARAPEGDRERAQTGWTFLLAAVPGDDTQIRRVADAVGFKYTYLPQRAEWAHPAALIFLSAAGVVSRYVYGIEFDPKMMRESIYKAGLAEPATAVGFMNRCYHFDPDENSHTRGAVTALRIGAGGFVVLVLAIFGVMHVIKRSKRPGVIRS
jgi:protein SCO1/2